MEYIPTEKQKKTFRDILFTMLNKILELSCDEFRGGYTQKVIKGNFVEEIYIPDARRRISQAIEFFSYLLQPFYDKDMEKVAKENKEKAKTNLKKFNDKKIDRDTFRINKLNLMMKLFEEQNHLLKRKDYLKGEAYEDVMEEYEEEERQMEEAEEVE